MKESQFKTICWLFCLGVGIALALVGCGPAFMPLTTPVSTLIPIVTPTTTPLLAPATAASPPRNGTTAPPTEQSSNRVVPIYTLCADGEWLWIATAQGLIQLDQNSMDYELFSRTGTSPDVALSYLYTLKVDDQGRLWAGGKPGLLRYTDAAGWKVIYTGEPVTDFGIDTEDNLWYWKVNPRWLSQQAYRFQGQEPPVAGDWKPEPVEWMSSDHHGWRFRAVLGESVQNESISDASGNTWTWLYMSSSLVIYRNDRRIHRVYLFPGSRMDAIAAANQTGIWIALENNLLYSDVENLKSYQFIID
jgi:ligand-binding sensor domain-containing protein